MRLIDADELLKAIANSGLVLETNECLDVIETLAVKKIIDDAPTISPAMALLNNFDEFYKERIKNGEDIGADMRGDV